MKKFLAILLACVMTLALAVPTMADTEYMITVDPDISNGIVMPNCSTGEEGITISLIVMANNGFELESLTVTDDQGSEIDVNIEGNSGNFVMPASNVAITATFVPEVTTTTVNTINAIIKPIVGEKISDFEVVIEGDAKDGIRPGILVNAKVHSGQESDENAYTGIEENEVFQEGYLYVIQPCYFYTTEGYEIADNAVLTINGETADYEDCRVTLGCISAYDVVVPAEAAPQNIDPAPTPSQKEKTTKTTTVKTGDTSDIMFYVIALIALVSYAGVTVFVRKKAK